MAERDIGGPGGGSKPGTSSRIVVATVLAGAIASAGTVGGVTSGTVVDSAAGRSISAKKANGKEAAKRGRSDEAWRRMGMRTGKQKANRT